MNEIIGWMMGIYLLILGGFDLKYKKVPLALLVAGGVLIVGWKLYDCVIGGSSFEQMLAGMTPGVGLLFVAWGSRQMGWADGIVLMQLGMIWGLWSALLLFFCSLLLLAVVSIPFMMLKKVGYRTAMPYFPFLTITFWIWRLGGR